MGCRRTVYEEDEPGSACRKPSDDDELDRSREGEGGGLHDCSPRPLPRLSARATKRCRIGRLLYPPVRLIGRANGEKPISRGFHDEDDANYVGRSTDRHLAYCSISQHDDQHTQFGLWPHAREVHWYQDLEGLLHKVGFRPSFISGRPGVSSYFVKEYILSKEEKTYLELEELLHNVVQDKDRI